MWFDDKNLKNHQLVTAGRDIVELFFYYSLRNLALKCMSKFFKDNKIVRARSASAVCSL